MAPRIGRHAPASSEGYAMQLDQSSTRPHRASLLAGHLCGTLAMPTDARTGTDRNRVAFATFGKASDVFRALGEIDELGISPDQMGLVGRTSALSPLAEASNCPNRQSASVKTLLAELQPLGITILNEPLLVSQGPLWPSLGCFGSSPSGPLVVASWMSQRICDELTKQISGGAVLFGVRAKSTEQQKLCTMILLRHGPHRVHTHEFKS